MNWTGQCFICNQTAYVMKGGAQIFSKKRLKSGKELSALISDLVQKPVTKGLTHSNLLCSKCTKKVVEYDILVMRCQKIEYDVMSLFKQTLGKLELEYNSYATEDITRPTESADEITDIQPCEIPLKQIKVAEDSEPIIISTEAKVPDPLVIARQGAVKGRQEPLIITSQEPKVVLPASKLQPLPADFVLTRNVVPDTRRKFHMPIVTKLKPISLEAINPTGNIDIEVNKTDTCHTEELPDDSDKTDLSSLLRFKETDLHNYSLSAFSECEGGVKAESVCDETADADDNPMEIDEECTLPAGQLQDGFLRLVPDGDVVKLQLEERSDDDEGHTIVMDENGSILRVVSGQRFMIGDQEISLVMPDAVEAGDGQDSNDGSQIELQVSGDEETANAIIAAAQEKGGAFIKVESGEMYRVESVESKDDSDDSTDTQFQVEKKAEGLFRCKFCERYMNADKVFEGDASAMMSHLRSLHDARLYICTACGKFVRRKSDYVKHLSSHTAGDGAALDKTKSYECNECPKKYSSRILLTEHLATHAGAKAGAQAGARPHVCAACGKDFANKYTYQAHCKTHTNRPRPFKCAQCSKSFFTQQNLAQHEKTHSGIKDFICKICGKAFGTQHNLEVHGVVHSRRKPFACGDCGKAFARRAELRDHVRIHTGERPFECEICHARFTQRSNLYSHRRATHTDDKRHACDRCPKRFKRKRLLDYHIQASHTGERPLVCGSCGAKFVYPEHYKKHLLIHSGAKPYTCEICGKSFNSRDNRNMHRFVHSDRKAYECLVCGASYMRKRLLYQHMNRRGHMAESIVINQPRIAVRSEFQDAKDDSNTEDGETIFERTEEAIENPESVIGKTFNIAPGGETTLLTIHNADGQLKPDEGLLQTFSVEQLDQSMLSDNVLVSEGEQRPAVMRLVQLQLRDGQSKWLAVE